jgi:hypothetical protein
MAGGKGLDCGGIELLYNGALSRPRRHFMSLNGNGLFRNFNRRAPFQGFQEKKNEHNQNNYN